MKHYWRTITLLALLAGSPCWSQQGVARLPLGGFDIGVRPQLIDLSGPAGARRSFDVHVRNFDSRRPARVWLWQADALQKPTGALDFAEVGTYEYSAARWMTLSRSELVIAPGAEEKVTVTLAVPGRALGSGHAVIVVSGAPPEDVPIPPPGEDQAYVVTRVAFGVIVHYAVLGTARDDAQIESIFLTSSPPPGSGMTEKTSPAKRWMVVRVRNRGNTMIYGHGWALLRRSKVGLVERWRLGRREEGSKRVIYPGRHVDLYLPIRRPLPTGEYVAQARLQFARGKAATGEVTLEVTADEAQDRFEAQAGPFSSLTIGLAVTVEREFEPVSVAPGGHRTGMIRVTNNESGPLYLTTSVLDVDMDADGTLVPSEPADGQPAAAANAWLAVGPEGFTLPPGGSRRLAYAVGPAADLPNKDDLIGLIQVRGRRLDAIAREAEDEVIGEAGVLLIASLAGRGQRKADLGLLQVEARPELVGKIRLGIPVQNTGNIHFFPLVTYQLVGRDNPTYSLERTVGHGDDRILVLPGQERMVWLELPQAQFHAGQYLATISLDYGGTELIRKSFHVHLHDPTTIPGPDPAQTPQPGGQGDQPLAPDPVRAQRELAQRYR